MHYFLYFEIIFLIEKTIAASLNMIFVYLHAEYEDEIGPLHWSSKRFDKVIALRESALQAARRAWADYLFVRKTEFMYLICNFRSYC